ncbi:hypothetical protein OGH69_15400 [Flavobacterium sp. MFBS3-15]|uniref:hypothetical protein n=1 Tax=Flavobacterium sp. MFBS3-15 TaxID=2989816 RepID=UPI002235D65E|nr:hypothetical protein [Flavobacterium sp. MFBS3-15]MCW4470359.1 hypothetical protein [Flavobacterium sp. MFBS3-15]
MKMLENKKISVSIILISISIILIAYLIKEPNDYTMVGYLQQHSLSIPLYLYDVNILGMTLPYKGIIIMFIILSGIGVYTFLYMTDEEVKSRAKKLPFIKSRNKPAKKAGWIMTAIITLALGAITGIIIAIKYYSSLQALQRPKTWGESFYIGFCNVFFAVLVISIITTIIKSLTKKAK